MATWLDHPNPNPNPNPNPDPNPNPTPKQARALVATWLLWLRALATEVPPTLRIDLLLSRAGPGRAELHTLELTEAGFSLLGWRGGPAQVTGATSTLSPVHLHFISPIPPHISPISAQVMGALLDACFQDSGPSAEEAATLAAFHARQPAAAGPEEPRHTRFVHHHQPTAAADGRASRDAGAEASAEAAREAAMYDSDDAASSRPAPSERPRGRGRGRS